ncbi:MAG: M20/M25/M40 family metallo-hydrolase [Acidobacteriota bacterium]|nr:M20/M25/M40 family metallo-hydrolase [Acidobacteriota bacterium]
MRCLLFALSLMCAGPAFAQADPDAAQRAEARAILARSIAFHTSESAGQTPAYAVYLRDLFVSAGVPAADTLIVPYERTAALLVRYRGDGSGPRPILLMAHMDVVEAKREDWERDPFTLVEENGFFYGRGVFDNKSGLVTLTSTLLRLKREGFVPTRDLVVAYTGDEETSGATARKLLAEHRHDWLDVEYALNTDAGQGTLDETSGAATIYAMQTAEKTFSSYTLTAVNPGGHSSQPRADNAIYDLMDALGRVRAYQFPVMWNDTTIAAFRIGGQTEHGALGQAMMRFAERPDDPRAAATLSASPFHVGQLRTTCIPTLLEAGHADNALPQRAVATVNCRIFPGVSIADVQAQLQRLAGETITVATRDTYYSSDASPLREDLMGAVTSAVHANHPGIPVTPAMSAGATDGAFYRGGGIPTYGVGEMFIKDSDDFSHGLNERIPVESFYTGLTHYRVLLQELVGRR